MKFLQNLKIDLAGVDVPLTQLSSAILQRILNGEKGGKIVTLKTLKYFNWLAFKCPR